MDLVEHLSMSREVCTVFLYFTSNCCFTALCLKPYQLTPLHNLSPLIFSLTPFSWLSTEMTTNDTTSALIIIISNSYTIISIYIQYMLYMKRLFELHPLSQERN